MSKIIVNTEVMGPDFSELVLHELNYEWSQIGRIFRSAWC